MQVHPVALLVAAVLLVPVCVILNIEPPDDCSDPWRLRMVLVPFKLFALACDWVLEPLLGEHVHVTYGRALMEWTYRMRSLPIHDPDIKVIEVTLGGVKAWLYRPLTLPPNGVPAFIYIHGGGWVFGTVVGFDRQSQTIALGAQVVVLSIEYRRAPEHPYPIPFTDCETAVTYFIKHAEQFGVDPNRIAISGDSAGGNLATAVSLSLRDKHVEPRIALQVLLYPVLQALDFNTPSYHKHENHAVVRKHIMVTCWLMYLFGHVRYRDAFLNNQHTSPEIKQLLYTKYMNLNDLPQDNIPSSYIPTVMSTGNVSIWREVKDLIQNPLLSPLLADDLSDLPKTYFLSVEQDILRDEGYWFVKRLRESGVEVKHSHFLRSFHGGLLFADRFEDSKVMLDDIIDYVKSNL